MHLRIVVAEGHLTQTNQHNTFHTPSHIILAVKEHIWTKVNDSFVQAQSLIPMNCECPCKCDGVLVALTLMPAMSASGTVAVREGQCYSRKGLAGRPSLLGAVVSLWTKAADSAIVQARHKRSFAVAHVIFPNIQL